MELTEFAALAIVAGAIVLILRGLDVRLILLAAALAIAGIGGDIRPVVREFFGTFSNEKFVVPICSAMGFAYVMRYVGCDRHLVLLLVRPLRHARGLLVPGVVLVGFLVNIPVISQTSTAVCIGPVVVPLMRTAGYSLATIGACLLLGVSVGGELLNPGAPELLTVFDKTGVSTTVQVHEYLPPLVFAQLAVSVVLIWILSRWWERGESQGLQPATPIDNELPMTITPVADERINLLKALVPSLPLGLLFLAGPPLNWIQVPQRWLVPYPPESASAAVVGSAAGWAAENKLHPLYSSRLIGAAMLVGVLAAALVGREKARDCVRVFFEGAGYGFATIVSLIVTANCFGKAIETAGVAKMLGRQIAATPELMQPLAAAVPLGFAALSGSGMASTQSLYGFFYGPAVALGLDPVAIGALVAVGAAAGRTMSPVAAVVLMCGTLSGTHPFALAKRVALPLICGLVVVVMLRMLGLL